MGEFILIISIYLWEYNPPIEYRVNVEECTEEVVASYRAMYKPVNGWKAIVTKCEEV